MDILKYRGLDYSDFRVPGEFEPQEYVILGWPAMAECIKGYSLHKAFAQLIKIIAEQAEGVTVYVNCPDQARVESCKKALAEEDFLGIQRTDHISGRQQLDKGLRPRHTGG